jgi:tetratricopeptide (TPR) repeat protein
MTDRLLRRGARRALLLLALTSATSVAAQPSASAPEAPPDVLAPAARRALGVETDTAAQLWTAGRAGLLAFQLDSARAAFARLGTAEPASAAGALGLETVALWQAFVMERAPFTDRFYVLNDSLGRVAGRLPDTPEGDLVRATATLHRALLLGREERYARAGLAFRDACGQFRTLPATVPDALFGQGVCEAAAGSIPRKYRWLGRLMGFSGTVAGGIDKLARAAAGDGAMAVEAVAALAIVDATLNERRAGGLARLREAAAARPGSPVLAYLDAYYLLADRHAVEAEAALRRAATALAAPGAAPFPFVDADLGMALFRQDRFADALPLLDRYARTYRGRALLAQTTLHAGLAAEMTGDRRAAEAWYGRVRAAREYDTDRAAAREAQRRRATPMTPPERALLLGRTAYDSGRLDEAVRRLQPVLTDAGQPDVVRAEAAYRTGRAYQALGNGAEAIRHFQLATARPGDPLARWGPWSVYHVGEVHEAAGRAAEAREAYLSALANETEYDFHQSLEQRARTALARLGD